MGLRSDTIEEGFADWIKSCYLSYKPDEMKTITQALWAIWKARNENLFNGRLQDPTAAIHKALALLMEWLEAQEKTHQSSGTSSNVVWKPPPENSLKVNIDAGWTGTEAIGFGLVVRDHNARMMFAATYMEPARFDPAMAEALALRWSLSVIEELGMDDVVIETDSMIVYKAMREAHCKPYIEPIILDCKFLASMFPKFSISHVKRKANNSAHSLAALANEFPSNVWWDNPPRSVAEAIFVDVFSFD
ncbi:uncharacterized protein LOC130713349 [Lotus japonicus]|uniref:uncharacterized protein LOC130713349 n=1 Tax=Lotus japonicus TaxID=34305 RepID=UPI00258F40CF|nr:uncharacterized protein LOC130713349 [Lotus japonicus]